MKIHKLIYDEFGYQKPKCNAVEIYATYNKLWAKVTCKNCLKMRKVRGK